MNFLMKLSTVKRWTLFGLVLCFLFQASLANGQSASVFPPKPEPAVYVHDYSGWLNPSQLNQLEQKLRAYFDTTSTQIIVMIRPDLGDYDKATYAFSLGEYWGVGQKGKDNGVIMLIKSEPPDRGIFIATGYGVEGALPDITAAQIIRNTMAPYFREQRYFEGIDAGTTDIIKALAGEFEADAPESADGVAIIVIVSVFLFLLFIFLYALRKAKKGGAYYSDLGRSQRGWGGPNTGGWWIGGGGGWGGSSGGGSSGGGGWDGGSFGGGSFGGGGAGGDW